MHLIRRAALRATSSPSTSIVSQSRSISTSSPFVLRSRVQSSISSSVFRRFNSDDAGISADGESGTVTSAIKSATESASTLSTDAASALGSTANTSTQGYGRARQGGYQSDRPSRQYGGDRGGDRGGYGGGRGGGGGYGDQQGGGYGGSRDMNSGFRNATRPSKPPPSPNPTIYVGNLLFDITAEDLTKDFGTFGTVKSAVIASDARGMSKGFGYVEFETTEQATAAIEAKHQTVFEGRRLVVNYQVQKSQSAFGAAGSNPPSKTLFIGNLAFEMSDADLNKLFREIRNVTDVRVAIDRRTGQPRGFAHADFVDVESATKGKEALQNKEVYGRTLRVDFSASHAGGSAAPAPAEA